MKIKPHIVITGADGFVGQHLTLALLHEDIRLTRVVRNKSDFDGVQTKEIIVDLTNSSDVNHLFSNLQPDYVIHLAGVKNRNASAADFQSSADKNVQMSSNLIEACLGIDTLKRFIFLGSCDEYGSSLEPFDEARKEVPNNAYGQAKLSVTKKLLTLFQEYQFPSIILRPSLIYGPGQGVEMFLSSLIDSLVSGKEFFMTKGEQYRDFIYISDVIDAILRAISVEDSANGMIFNIGSGESIKIFDVVNKVVNFIEPSLHQKIKFGSLSYRSSEVMNYSVKIDRAEKLLNWQPKTPMNIGLKKTIEYFKNQKKSFGA